jgi:hypothetical protein
MAEAAAVPKGEEAPPAGPVDTAKDGGAVKETAGVPAVEFIEDVDKFMEESKLDYKAVIDEMNELHSKFSTLEHNLETKKARWDDLGILPRELLS